MMKEFKRRCLIVGVVLCAGLAGVAAAEGTIAVNSTVPQSG